MTEVLWRIKKTLLYLMTKFAYIRLKFKIIFASNPPECDLT